MQQACIIHRQQAESDPLPNFSNHDMPSNRISRAIMNHQIAMSTADHS